MEKKSGWRLTQRKKQAVLVNGNLQVPVHVPVSTKPGQDLMKLRDKQKAAEIYFAARRLASQDKCWVRADEGWVLKTSRGDITLRYDKTQRDVQLEPAEKLDKSHRLAMRLAYLFRARAFLKARARRVLGGTRWRFVGSLSRRRSKRFF